MYPTTYQTGGARRPTPRTWLAAGGALVALLVVLFLVLAACQNAGTDQTDPLAGAAGGTPAPSASPAPSADGIGGNGGENPDQGGDQGGSDPPGGGGDPPPDPEDPGEGEPEPEPLSIEPVITEVAPNGHCSASGTITVEGGEYPLTVDYQWGQLTWGLNIEPMSPVLSHTFDEPGGISVQTKDLPEDGINVVLTVSSPESVYSVPVEYDGCSGQAGGGSFDS